jgi:hypothetical protein
MVIGTSEKQIYEMAKKRVEEELEFSYSHDKVNGTSEPEKKETGKGLDSYGASVL